MHPIGLDYSLPSVQKARLRSDASIPWMVGDATQLPVQPGSLDGVMCFGVLQALGRPDVAIKELTGTVRPGGQIWIDALNRDCLSTLAKRLKARLQGQALNLRYDRPRDLVRCLKQHGATQVQVHWIPILPARLQSLQPLLETAAMRAVFRAMPLVGSLFSHAILISARQGQDRSG